ncbi:penicillin-binding transpeptidase domain-containing protein [Clostridium sp.]|uniref:penicillin-binding transpeptidase domain-containing protein n=1 Tax=Clostridium sp. TaxID=1506 RepID=UPI003D6D9C71
MSKKKMKIFFLVILGIIIILIAVFIFSVFTKGVSAAKTFDTYKNSWVKKDYKTMYSMISNKTKEKITQDDFVKKYTDIYGGIEAESISIKLNNKDEIKDGNEKTINIPFSIAMKTAVGQLNESGYTAIMVKEKVDNENKWTIVWDEKMIFPSMEAGDKVRIVPALATRGEIYDRNGKPLAKNEQIPILGLKPIDFVIDKDNNISQLAEILDIDAAVIEDKLKGNENSTQFLPIVNIIKGDKTSEANKLDGVLFQSDIGRVYPGGEAFGSLIGYIRPIQADDIKRMPGQGYSSVSFIGAAGVEQVYEKRLKGENGGRIYISDKSGVEKKEILTKESKAGENITLSVELVLQTKIYEGMKNDAGASAAINPKTGEVLALVSSPSYDSNAYTTYKSNTIVAKWEELQKSGVDPFQNRFSRAYSPGSTFKLITAAIGLEQGTIDPTKKIEIIGEKWQKDASWGPHMVTRVGTRVAPVNLQDAFVFSDNIYFAMSALDIGKDEFIKGSSKFGIGEKLPIVYPMVKSQVATDKIINDEALADTGYGQGQVLMSPLHIALAYSSIVNDGNIMSPTLEGFNEKVKSKVWKESVISKENVKIIKDDLTAVIDTKGGTGNAAQIAGVVLAGKTGTAELKKNAEDANAKENGWFICMDTANPKIVVAMLIEDVKGRGGSHYVVPIVKEVMEYYLKR